MNLYTKIDLNAVAIHIQKITYEPDQFPGAVLRMKEGPVSLIFASGKIVIAGSKSEDQLRSAVSTLQSLLKPYSIE